MADKRPTRHFNLSGKVKHVRGTIPNQFGDYKVQLYPDERSLEVIKGLLSEGLKNTLRKDEDGYHMDFKRPTTKQYGTKVMTFAPPLMTDKDDHPFTGNVGNGSDGIVTIEVYNFKNFAGIAARWEGLKITNLVPFEPSTDYSEEEKKIVDRASKYVPVTYF